MGRLRKIDNLIKKIEATTACIMLVTIVLVGTLQIIFRFLLNSSLVWSEELMRYLFVWLSFITASIAVREHKHISVDFVTTFMPARVNIILLLLHLSRICSHACIYILHGSTTRAMYENGICQVYYFTYNLELGICRAAYQRNNYYAYFNGICILYGCTRPERAHQG